MKLFGTVVCTLMLVLCLSASALAQSDDNPFLLQRGDNEFGFWAGGSPKATTIFGGLRDDEAEDRKFFIAAFRYGRTLAANDSLALQYTLDAIPVALATGTIVSRTTPVVLPRFNARLLTAQELHRLDCNSIWRTAQRSIRLCT